MKKQELIAHIEKIEYEHLHYNSPESMLLEQKQIILDFVKQLDEPQKPVVPKFVADWFEDNKDDLEFAIWKLTIDSNSNYTKNKNEMRHWIQYVPNKPYKTLIGMLNGYEVEKEPLYHVPLPDKKDDSEVVYALEKKHDGSIEISLIDRRKLGVSDSTKLFEWEIKSVDERYLPFAVRIKEVTED